MSPPCFPTFGFPSCKEALGSGLSHCPLPGPPHLPFTVPSPTVFPGPVSCPDSTRLAQLHVVGQSAPTFPPHAVLLHTSCSLLPKPSFAVGWMMGAPLHHLSLETPTTQADGLSSSHPTDNHPFFALPIPHLTAPASTAFCFQSSCSAIPSHSSGCQAIAPFPNRPSTSLQLVVSSASQPHLLFPRFLVLSFEFHPFSIQIRGFSPPGFPEGKREVAGSTGQRKALRDSNSA